MKILLVEDEEMLNGITAKYLRAENMTVDTCFNGQQAIDYVNTSSYDVIVMDIMMPILDGISALAQMRNDGNTTPVLLLTAKDSLQDKVTGLNTGADDYLVKPFDLEELTARIYALARRNARHAQNDIHVGPPVSYTHLDVYKRQLRANTLKLYPVALDASRREISVLTSTLGFLDCFVIILITPPFASEPYRALAGPRVISMRSTLSLSLIHI